MTSEPFVPPDFVVPLRLETPQFVLEPLGPQHNDADYEAWSSSMEHIHATPGWEESKWPRSMTLDENRADLERHASDFESRTGFTYTVLSPGGDVIGCVYIYPFEAGRCRRAGALLGPRERSGARCAAVESCQRLGRVGLAFRKGRVRDP